VIATPEGSQKPETYGGLKQKLVRGGIAVALLIGAVVGIVGLVPGLSGVRAAISGASTGWVAAAAGIQLVQVAGAVVFVQLVFAEEPRRLTARMGGAQQAANAVLPTAGSTAVSYWVLSSLGWGVRRFAERTAVMVVAPAAPNFVLIGIVGLGMGFGLFSGPGDWWLTFLPAALAVLVAATALCVARWGHKLAGRTRRHWLRDVLDVAATGVSGTFEILRRPDWRVLGTWADLLASIAVLWACLTAVGEHLPIAVVAMGYLLGQFLQVIPVPGGVGTIDAGVAGALVLYGGDSSKAPGGELISHALQLTVSLAVGAIGFVLLPSEIDRARRARDAAEASTGN